MLVTLLVSNKYTTKLPTAGIKNIYELFGLVFFRLFPYHSIQERKSS